MHTITDELALINMQAREYDPSLALFLQPDPLQEQGDPHPYAYANHNPLKYIDPTGTSYVNPFGGSPGYNYGTGFDMGSRSTCITCYSDGKTVNWNSFNSSPSLGAFGSTGTALTSYNTSWNGGGMTGYVAPQNTVGAGSSTGTPAQPTSSWRDNVAGSLGGGASVQVVYAGASGSIGKTYDANYNSCSYVSLCGRLGYGLALGGGGEVAAKSGEPLKNGWDYSYGYYYSGGSGLFGDFSVNVDKGMDGLEYSASPERFGWGWGGAVGYQWCGTLNFGCD